MDKRMTLQNDRVHAATTLTQAMTSTTNGRTFINWQRGGMQSCGQTGENSGRTVMYSSLTPEEEQALVILGLTVSLGIRQSINVCGKELRESREFRL